MRPISGSWAGLKVRRLREMALVWLAIGLLGPAPSSAEPQAASTQGSRPRVVVMTDIGNEPDDSESFVRFLLYSNEFDTEALIATTSTWQRTRVQPELLRERIDGYGKVLANLRHHAEGYPDPASLLAAVRSGSALYGMQGVGQGMDSEASRRIIEIVDKPDPRPVHVAIWSGAHDLAQALWTVRATRSPKEAKAFVAKLRVYSISDQDDAGPWARQNFPDLIWIASVHGWGQYAMAAWTGISGDLFSKDKWPGSELVTNEWLDRNIRRGALGALYPPHQYIMEGDTPSFLGLIRNGLNDPEHPEFGGWGGRYLPAYEGAGHYADAPDKVENPAGRTWTSSQATIFRWREAFQNDFAARIGWTLTADPRQANHNPQLVLNGVPGDAAVKIAAKSGAEIALFAYGSLDPDGDRLTYRWWQYAEATSPPSRQPAALKIEGADSPQAHVVVPAVSAPATYHVILEVTDSGAPALTSYRRALIAVTP